MSNWYIIFNNQSIGPMTKEGLMAYNPSSDTLVWREGMENWQPIYTIPELMQMLNNVASPAGPPSYGTPGSTPPPVSRSIYTRKSQKDKTTAGILALLFGGIGVQYFYLGKVGGGLLTILLTICTCGLWSTLMFVQGIVLLTMSNEDFERKFVYSNNFMPIF